MAVSLLYDEISQLCLGKPELPCISATASVSYALSALKDSGAGTSFCVLESCSEDIRKGSCICLGTFALADVILFLCHEDNLAHPFKVFEAPVSHVLRIKPFPGVTVLDPTSNLLEAIDCILQGTQHLVIPIKRRRRFSTNSHHHNSNNNNNKSYCWLTPADILRYLLNSITAFSPTTTLTVESLDIINADIVTLRYNSSASSALVHLCDAVNEYKPIAVVDEVNRLVGEISPLNMSCCDESVAAAITTLSVYDLVAYMEGNDAPEDLVRLVKVRLEEKGLIRMVELVDEVSQPSMSSYGSSSSLSSSCCCSDDESLSLSGRWSSCSKVVGNIGPVRKTDTIWL